MMKTILLLLLSFTLLFSAFGSSCAEKPKPSTKNYGDAKVTYFYKSERELISHIRVRERCWWDFSNVYYQMRIPESGQKTMEEKPWTPDMLPDIVPNDTVIVTKKVPYSHLSVSDAVADFLESEDPAKKDFVILFVLAKETHLEYGQGLNMTSEAKNEWLMQWCEAYDLDGTVIGDTGHILWEDRTAAELISFNVSLDEWKYTNFPHTPFDIGIDEEGVLVCFLEEVEALYGVTFEQADILYEKGYLDAWCTATIENSPLYGLSPDEIAAYIAAHPEILEE